MAKRVSLVCDSAIKKKNGMNECCRRQERKQTKTNGSVSLTMISPIIRNIPSLMRQLRVSLREFRSASNNKWKKEL